MKQFWSNSLSVTKFLFFTSYAPIQISSTLSSISSFLNIKISQNSFKVQLKPKTLTTPFIPWVKPPFAFYPPANSKNVHLSPKRVCTSSLTRVRDSFWLCLDKIPIGRRFLPGRGDAHRGTHAYLPHTCSPWRDAGAEAPRTALLSCSCSPLSRETTVQAAPSAATGT